MKPHHEVVRSGRRQNFFMIENAFIDDWAKVVGLISIAVYCCLWRHADGCNSTFIGTPKLAEKLKLSPRAMQRAIKTLADHKLICIVRTMKPVRQTVYQMLPVPSSAKEPSPMRMFDWMPAQTSESTSAQAGANRRRKAGDCTVARVGGLPTAQARGGDCTVAAPPPVLIEQDPFNKRGRQYTGTSEIRSSESQPPPSRPGEFHPEPLTDPDVNLSIHPARATHRRLPPSVKERSSSGCPLTPARHG